jgi:hypothetical protein
MLAVESRACPPDVSCGIDTDPSTARLLRTYRSTFTASRLWRTTTSTPGRFDEIVELITAHEHDAAIDAGATSFVALAHYMITNQIPALFHELERTRVVRVPIVGGPAFLDTLQGFHGLVSQFPDRCRFPFRDQRNF